MITLPPTVAELVARIDAMQDVSPAVRELLDDIKARLLVEPVWNRFYNCNKAR